MQAVIDIGNTKVKAGFFDGYSFLEKHEIHTLKQLDALLASHKVRQVGLGCVGEDSLGIARWLSEGDFLVYPISYASKMPVKIEYKTPKTLGTDRIAGAVGAWEMCHSAVLVVDFGTCITYDFVNNDAEYLGGAISPGVNLRLKAMGAFTANLPRLRHQGFPPLLGQSTETCMQSGVVHGVLFEVRQMIEAYAHELGDFQLIFTGGAAFFFEKKLKAKIFVRPNLILEGLNTILLSNVQTN